MSRRFNLGILTKNKHNKIKNLSFNELKAKYGSEEGVHVSKLSKEVFCIGKIFDDSLLKPYSSYAFSDEVQKKVNEEDSFYIINQEGFKFLIEHYRTTIADNFKQLLGDPSQTDKETEDSRFSYIYFRHQEWGNDLGIKPYNLEDDTITKSSTPEYAIFELIRIYKSINWNNQLVCISAW